MKVKMILPALAESESPYWRPIKYSLFPPIGLATLASFLSKDDSIELIDQHVEKLNLDDTPELVIIQVYVTNAYRAYKIADQYRSKGSYVLLGGLHVTSLPDEAMLHADTIFLGPAEQSFPEFLDDFRKGKEKKVYSSTNRTLVGLPIIRRDLIKRERYLVPNSLVVSRGCPHNCNFCYKHSFFKGGRSFYTQHIDDALDEIDRLQGRHLYFLDDHLFGNKQFAEGLFDGMRGMGRIFQSAATVESILQGNLIEKAAEAGLRSLFIGFETFSGANLTMSNMKHNKAHSYEKAVQKLHDLGIMINGSFVFGLDNDGIDVFDRTVEWSVNNAITTATFHILTPYPGTRLYDVLNQENRIESRNWDNYDTRHAVFTPRGISKEALEAGYLRAYKDFYSWRNIVKSSFNHSNYKHVLKHFFYTGGWKKFEPVWNFIIKTKGLNKMLPLLELLLSEINYKAKKHKKTILFKEDHLKKQVI